MRVQFSEYATHQEYLVKKVDELDTDVKEVKRLVFQVKWAIVGAAVVLTAGQMGLLEMLGAVLFK